MLTCTELLTFINEVSLCVSKQLLVDALALLMLLVKEGPVGRISASRILNMPERRVRRLVGHLKDCGMVQVDRAAGAYVASDLVEKVLKLVNTVSVQGHAITLLNCISPKLAEVITKRVVTLRDMIVASTGNPHTVELIAVLDEELKAPGVPRELVEYYAKLVRGALETSSCTPHCLVVIWGEYRKWICEAVLLKCVAMLCHEFAQV